VNVSAVELFSSPFSKGEYKGDLQVPNMRISILRPVPGTPPFLRRRKQSICHLIKGKREKKYPSVLVFGNSALDIGY